MSRPSFLKRSKPAGGEWPSSEMCRASAVAHAGAVGWADRSFGRPYRASAFAGGRSDGGYRATPPNPGRDGDADSVRGPSRLRGRNPTRFVLPPMPRSVGECVPSPPPPVGSRFITTVIVLPRRFLPRRVGAPFRKFAPARCHHFCCTRLSFLSRFQPSSRFASNIPCHYLPLALAGLVFAGVTCGWITRACSKAGLSRRGQGSRRQLA